MRLGRKSLLSGSGAQGPWVLSLTKLAECNDQNYNFNHHNRLALQPPSSKFLSHISTLTQGWPVHYTAWGKGAEVTTTYLDTHMYEHAHDTHVHLHALKKMHTNAHQDTMSPPPGPEAPLLMSQAFQANPSTRRPLPCCSGQL